MAQVCTCPKCKSETLTYDQTTELFHCAICGNSYFKEALASDSTTLNALNPNLLSTYSSGKDQMLVLNSQSKKDSNASSPSKKKAKTQKNAKNQVQDIKKREQELKDQENLNKEYQAYLEQIPLIIKKNNEKNFERDELEIVRIPIKETKPKEQAITQEKEQVTKEEPKAPPIVPVVPPLEPPKEETPLSFEESLDRMTQKELKTLFTEKKKTYNKKSRSIFDYGQEEGMSMKEYKDKVKEMNKALKKDEEEILLIEKALKKAKKEKR